MVKLDIRIWVWKDVPLLLRVNWLLCCNWLINCRARRHGKHSPYYIWPASVPTFNLDVELINYLADTNYINFFLSSITSRYGTLVDIHFSSENFEACVETLDFVHQGICPWLSIPLICMFMLYVEVCMHVGLLISYQSDPKEEKEKPHLQL